MFTPEQSVRLEIVRLLLEANTPPERVEDFAIRLSVWILTNVRSLPCGTDDKA